MRISRLYTPVTLLVGKTIALDENSSHYLRSVLRLRKGDSLILFNGDGADYTGQLAEMDRKSVMVAISEKQLRSVESPLTINLGLGISRGDRMDLSVQKAVELGANNLTPIITERCVVQFKDDKKQQRLDHWQKIVYHAAEQSGRTSLPTLSAIDTLTHWLPLQTGLKLFLDPHASHTLTSLKPQAHQVTLLTGPEGGFAEHEREFAIAAGFIPVRLGQRILRTETASLAALAAVQMLWGDFAQ